MSATQRHLRYMLSLPWKAGSLITVQTAGCDADDCGPRGKLMHGCVSHFRRKGPTEDAIEHPNLRRTSDPDQGQRHGLQTSLVNSF